MALPRLTFVTGKGGTGKSTVAAALALRLARFGPTTLAELDRQRSASRLISPAGNGARRPRGQLGALTLVELSGRAELETFIEAIVPVRALARRMLRSRTFGYVTAALPGLESFLLLERLRRMAGDSALTDCRVVADGPAAGGALELLSVARGVGGIAPAGTLNRLSATLEEFLCDPARFAVLITTTPDELAVRETIESARTLTRELDVGIVSIVLNGVPAPLFDTADLAAASAVREHAELAVRRTALGERAARARDALAAEGLAVVELPLIFRARLGMAEVSAFGECLIAGLARK
jgi:hypothetical protein